MRSIVNESEYNAIMARVNELVEIVDDHTSPYDKNYVELDFLTDIVVEYEKEYYPIGKSEPTLQIARRIYRKLNIDAEVLLGVV
jgi:antitoxin component HigA of HigAB toxin-antitoxin module